MKKLLMFITAIAVMFGGLAFVAPTANADGGTESGSEITSESSSSSADSAQVTSSAHAGGTITAKTVAYVKAKGTPKAKQTNCRTTKKAASYWTSYVNSSGQEVWHWKWYPKGKRFCKIGGVMRDPVCHNKVKIGVPKAKKPRGIIITGKINVITSFKFVAEAEAKVTATGKATAKAWCQNEWTYAEAYASASAYSYAYARARATGTTKAKAEAAARGAASQLSLSASFKGNVEVDAKAKAKATATADAYAKVTCGEGPVPAHDECPDIPGNQPEGYDCTGPKGVIVGPLHLYEHGTATYRVRGSDNTDGANVDIEVWFTGNVTGSFVGSSVVDGEKVVEYRLVAGPNNGTEDHGYMHARVTDQDGNVKTLEPHKIFVEPSDTGD